jgi:hypothetical protein
MKNAVLITLIHLRDVVYGSGRSNHSLPPKPLNLPPKSITSLPPPLPIGGRPGGVNCPNPACPNRTNSGKLWLNIGVHLKACKKKYPPPS